MSEFDGRKASYIATLVDAAKVCSTDGGELGRRARELLEDTDLVTSVEAWQRAHPLWVLRRNTERTMLRLVPRRLLVWWFLKRMVR